MNSRLHKYDLSSLSSFGTESATGVEAPELRELVLSSRDLRRDFIDDTNGAGISDWPVAIHLPESYEEGYAYPLVIWLHEDNSSEGSIDYVMPSISDRNYIGLSFRANCPAIGFPLDRYRWSMNLDESSFFEDVLYVTVCRLRRAYHIHSERIVVAGSGSGATLALQTFLRQPQWFSGAMMLGGRMPALDQPLLNYNQVRGKRVLQIADKSDPHLDVDEFRKLRRLLHTAGMSVTTSVAETNVPCEETLRCADYWMMNGLRSTALV